MRILEKKTKRICLVAALATVVLVPSAASAKAMYLSPATDANSDFFACSFFNSAGRSVVYSGIKKVFAVKTEKAKIVKKVVPKAAKKIQVATIKAGDVPDKKIKAVLTAYTSTPGQTDGNPFMSASGIRVYDGMIAANGLPFGTKIKIPALFGDKVFTVHDRMNKRYGLGRMDIWLDAPRSVALKFGVKRADAEIYYPDSLLTVAK